MKLQLTSPTTITMTTNNEQRVVLADEAGNILTEYLMPAHTKVILAFPNK